MKLAALLLTVASAGLAGDLITLPSQSPLITIRLVFRTGSAADPPGKEGLAAFTAAMIAQGGSAKTPYKQILDALFPMAVSIESNVDKEMTVFAVETHVDNLERLYLLFRQMLIEPGWRADDLARLKDQSVNFLRVSLRGNNDEELGKEVLYNEIYSGHPYGHHNAGRANAISAFTAADLQSFYKRHYTQANLTIALAGAYPAGFPARIQKDFAVLPRGDGKPARLPSPHPIRGRQLTIVEKDTRSVAISLGFPIAVRRGHPDFIPLLVAQSWLGQHRNSGVRLYDRIRELRGLNYGDYAYLEYFPRGMFLMEPDANLARRQQIFQVWVRPVIPETAHFTLRLAIFELERLHREGLSQEDFDKTKNFLSKYVNLLIKTKRAELGYAIDSKFYGIGNFSEYTRAGLAKVTRDDVNRAVKKHLAFDNMSIVMVAPNAAALRRQIVEETPSPMKYNSPKPAAILEEDRIVERLALKVPAANARVIPAGTVFE